MRAQSGTSSLRALIYFDEIFGYLPPVSNPPSKEPMLRMLKQARAFGVGLVLVTQNPVDVDYKGLSNTGTWFIGKLQTDQDKQRLLDGLQGAVSGGLNRSAYDRMISGLGKRVFLMHNVHNKEPLLMQTRWAMNYLTGPLTRSQIPDLNRLAAISSASSTVADQPSPQAPTAPVQRAERPKQALQAAGLLSTTRPSVPNGIDEYFLPFNQTLSEALEATSAAVDQSHPQKSIVCHPVLVAQARTLFLNRKYNLDFELAQAVIVSSPDRRGVVRWENFSADPIDPRSLADQPDPQVQFSSLDGPLGDPKILASLQRDFADWAFRSAKVTIRANEELKVFAGPDVSQADFRQLCSDAARKARDAEIETLSQGYDRKVNALQEKIKRKQRELDQDETKLSQRKLEELGTHAETLLSLFAKRKSSRRISSSLSKRRMAAEAKASVVKSQQTIEDLTQQVAELEKERDKAIAAVENRWGDIAAQIQELTITPLKKDVQVELFGVAWFPYYQLESGGQVVELPAFSAS